jgi:hypothetical protein
MSIGPKLSRFRPPREGMIAVMKTRDIHSGRLYRLSLLLAALAAMLMLLINAGGAGAAWPGKDGQVVFEGYRAIGGEGYERTGLRSFSFSSTNPATQLTSEMGDQDPQVSPNGLLVAFARVNGAGRYAIFLMNRDGGEVRQLTNPGERESDGEPAFDSSGTHVMFVRLKPGGKPYLLRRGRKSVAAEAGQWCRR